MQAFTGLAWAVICLPALSVSLSSSPWVVAGCQVFLSKDSLDDLVTLLTKARVVDRLLEFMPPSKRSSEAFKDHFTQAGLLQVS